MNKKLLLGASSILAAVAPIATVISCGDKDSPTTHTVASTPTVVPNYRQDFASSNSWYTGSAEMKAMAKTEYKAAEGMFDALARQSTIDKNKVDTSGNVTNPAENKFIPVVFMDIDETVLSNISYQNYNILNNKTFSSKSWNNWVKAHQAIGIAGAADFINHVWENGGVVMFNSDRDQSLKDATKTNLVASGVKEKYIHDWNFWMQGIDPNKAKPWTVSGNAHTNKEARMDKMNKAASTYDLSSDGSSGNAVKFRVVMRVGDNLNDFNDFASKHALNKERIKVYEHIKDNFGSTTHHGKIYDKTSNTWKDETWNEAYVLIGGNSAYGGWEEGLKKGYFGLTPKEQHQARLDGLKAIPVWDGTATWNGK